MRRSKHSLLALGMQRVSSALELNILTVAGAHQSSTAQLAAENTQKVAVALGALLAESMLW